MGWTCPNCDHALSLAHDHVEAINKHELRCECGYIGLQKIPKIAAHAQHTYICMKCEATFEGVGTAHDHYC